MTKLLTVCSILILFISCEEKKKKKEQAEIDIVKVEIQKMAEKYDAIQDWDTLDFDYTIQYQDLFSDSNRLILIDKYVDITDIKKDRNKYYISGNSNFYPTFYFRLECEKSQIYSLMNMDISYRSNIGLISKITSVKKLVILLGSEIDYDYKQTGEYSYETNPYSYLQIQGTDDFLLTGKLIDFYIKNK